MLSRFCSDPIFHPCSFLLIREPPPAINFQQTSTVVCFYTDRVASHIPRPTAATVAPPVPGCHDTFCVVPKLLAKSENTVA